MAEKMQKTLSKRDLRKAFMLVYSSECAYNYERMQALGNTNLMISVVDKLYDTHEEKVEALKKYMVFFNTDPSWMGTIVHGITVSMEEQIANGAPMSAEEVNAVRVGLMGPMAGIGDTISQAVIYPILASICCSLALAGNYAGPILFELIYKALMILCGYNMFMLGYKGGKSAVYSMLSSGLMDRVTEIASVVGLMVVGNLAFSKVAVSCPLVFHIQDTEFIMQDILNQLLPGLIPLGITMGTWYLLSKRKMKSTTVILIMFIVGILASVTGLLAQAA